MILRDRPGVLTLFFVMRGSLIVRIWPLILGVGLMSGLVVWAHRALPELVPGVDPAPFALFGIALSIFLSFRNNASYDRWWEARRHWGQIIRTSRDITRQTLVLDAPGGSVSAERREVLGKVIAFAAACVAELRPDPNRDTADDVPPPDRLLGELTLTVAQLLRAGRLEPIEAHGLNESLTRLGEAFVACERLANTPLPLAYTLLLHRTAYLFCFILPFGLVEAMGWTTPLAVMLVTYTFFGLDALAEELEEPFGLMPNDLPLAAYAVTIERQLRAAMGDTDLPPRPEPDRFLLR